MRMSARFDHRSSRSNPSSYIASLEHYIKDREMVVSFLKEALVKSSGQNKALINEWIINELKEKAPPSVESREALELKVYNLSDQLSALRSELTVTDEKKLQAVDEVNMLREQLETLSETVEKQRQKIERFVEEEASVAATVIARDEQIRTQSAMLEALETQLQKLIAKYKASQRTIEAQAFSLEQQSRALQLIPDSTLEKAKTLSPEGPIDATVPPRNRRRASSSIWSAVAPTPPALLPPPKPRSPSLKEIPKATSIHAVENPTVSPYDPMAGRSGLQNYTNGVVTSTLSRGQSSSHPRTLQALRNSRENANSVDYSSSGQRNTYRMGPKPVNSGENVHTESSADSLTPEQIQSLKNELISLRAQLDSALRSREQALKDAKTELDRVNRENAILRGSNQASQNGGVTTPNGAGEALFRSLSRSRSAFRSLMDPQEQSTVGMQASGASTPRGSVPVIMTEAELQALLQREGRRVRELLEQTGRDSALVASEVTNERRDEELRALQVSFEAMKRRLQSEHEDDLRLIREGHQRDLALAKERLDREMAKLRSALPSNSNISNSNEELLRLKEEKVMLESALQSTKESLKQALALVDSLETDVAQKNRDLAQLQDKLREQRTELEEVRKKAEENERKSLKSVGSTVAAESKISLLEAQIAELEDKLNAAETRAMEAETALEMAHSTAKRRSKKAEGTAAEKEELEERIKELESRVEMLNESRELENKRAQEEFDAVIDRCAELEEKLKKYEP